MHTTSTRHATRDRSHDTPNAASSPTTAALDPSGLALLALGTALTFLAHMRWGVGLAGWFAPLPWLLYLGRTGGRAASALLVRAVSMNPGGTVSTRSPWLIHAIRRGLRPWKMSP